jgi:hypothetical protein
MENSYVLPAHLVPASQTVLENAHLRDALIEALRRVLIGARCWEKAFEMNLELFEDHALAGKEPLQFGDLLMWSHGYGSERSGFSRAAW